MSRTSGSNSIPELYCDLGFHLGRDVPIATNCATIKRSVVKGVLAVKVAVIALPGFATFKAVAADNAAKVDARLLRLSVLC